MFLIRGNININSNRMLNCLANTDEFYRQQSSSLIGLTGNTNAGKFNSIITKNPIIEDIDNPSPKYYYSLFNADKTFSDGEKIIINFSSDSVIVLDKYENVMLTNILSGNISPEMNLLTRYLLALGIIYTENENEYDNLKTNYHENNLGQSRHLTFVIDITYECNARCFYCFNGLKNNIGVMSNSTIDSVINNIVNMVKFDDVITFQWFGGEPLLYQEKIDYFVDQFKCQTKGRIKFDSVVNTNGSLVDSELIIKAKQKWNTKMFKLVLDGFSQNHDKRKNYFCNNSDSCYSSLLNTIDRISEKDISVFLRINLDWKNLIDLPSVLYDLKKHMGNDKIFIYPTTLHNPNKIRKKSHYIENADFNTAYEIIFKEMFTTGFYKHINDIIPRSLTKSNIDSLINTYLVDVNGNIVSCTPGLFNVNECLSIKMINNDYSIKISQQCYECTFLPICYGGFRSFRQVISHFDPCVRTKYYIDTIMDMLFKWIN